MQRRLALAMALIGDSKVSANRVDFRFKFYCKDSKTTSLKISIFDIGISFILLLESYLNVFLLL